jgi:hypothetical protein
MEGRLAKRLNGRMLLSPFLMVGEFEDRLPTRRSMPFVLATVKDA